MGRAQGKVATATQTLAQRRPARSAASDQVNDQFTPIFGTGRGLSSQQEGELSLAPVSDQEPSTEPKSIIDAAAARAAARRAQVARQAPRDYAALNKIISKQKAALTRAINSSDPEKVVIACKNAVEQWGSSGCLWPDDWSRWQRALDDACLQINRTGLSPGGTLDLRLEDL